MTAGAAQILMKSDGLVAQNAVLVGSGPLLYLVATQLNAAGAPPKALIETQTRQNLVAALAHLLDALKGWKQLAKGLRFLPNSNERRLHDSRLPVILQFKERDAPKLSCFAQMENIIA